MIVHFWITPTLPKIGDVLHRQPLQVQITVKKTAWDGLTTNVAAAAMKENITLKEL
jgi:hypothetical protein